MTSFQTSLSSLLSPPSVEFKFLHLPATPKRRNGKHLCPENGHDFVARKWTQFRVHFVDTICVHFQFCDLEMAQFWNQKWPRNRVHFLATKSWPVSGRNISSKGVFSYFQNPCPENGHKIVSVFWTQFCVHFWNQKIKNSKSPPSFSAPLCVTFWKRKSGKSCPFSGHDFGFIFGHAAPLVHISATFILQTDSASKQPCFLGQSWAQMHASTCTP